MPTKHPPHGGGVSDADGKAGDDQGAPPSSMKRTTLQAKMRKPRIDTRSLRETGCSSGRV